MDPMLKASEVVVGFHPAGYRIDRTASPMNRYTKWQIVDGRGWCNPEPVCFDSLPQDGWIVKDKFDWNQVDMTAE